jgi:photosystem II stability/assembly factor-like uncharacterized protein
MRYSTIIIFALCLISGCKNDAPITSIEKPGVDTVSVSTFPRNATTYGWEKVNLNSSVSDFAFDSKGNVYIINLKGLYRADENFVIKDTIEIPSSSAFYPSKIFINENDILFLAEYSGFNYHLFVSTDKGKTWFSPNGFHDTQIQYFFSKGSRVYIASSGSDESQGMVQISEDNGNNWRTIINSGTMGYFDFCKENGTNEIFFFGNQSLFYSNNFGATYTERKSNFQYPWDNSLAFGNNKNLLIGNDSGIFLTSDNGITWQSIYNNTSTDFFTLFNAPDGYIFAMHRWFTSSSNYGLRGVYVSKNGGITWYSFLSKPEGIFNGSYQVGKDGYLYIVSNVNNITSLYRSTAKL